MSLLSYTNSTNVIKSLSPIEGERFSEQDQKLLKGVLFNPTFGNTTTYTDNDEVGSEVVELHLYSQKGGYLNSKYDVSSWETILRPSNSVENKIRLDVHNDIRSLGYERGQYKIVYNFLKNHIASSNSVDKLFIYDISPSRKELKIRISNPENISLQSQVNNFFSNVAIDTKYKSLFLLNFGDNLLVQTINVQQFDSNEFWVKLYEPLPLELDEGKSCWLVTEVVQPYIDNIILIPNALERSGNKLSGPNFDIDTEFSNISSTNLKNWNDLLSESSQTSQQLIDHYFSGSLTGVKLNIRFNEWDNFIHFSSAEERLKNFVYKLRLIEVYDRQLATLDDVVGDLGGNRISVIQKRNAIISGFDDFEKYLYFEVDNEIYTYPGSSSIVPFPKQEVTGTGSIFTWQTAYQQWYEANVSFDSTNDVQLAQFNYPYVLQSTTSSIAQDWISDTLESAINYDNENLHSLRKVLPSHILADSANDEFVLFTDMLGHHFDILWLYTKHLTERHVKEEHPEDGVSNDLLFDIAKSMGWNLAHGTQTSELWEYTFGTDSNLIKQQSGSSGVRTKPYEKRTKEVWRRIVNNLPYILKTKGTARSVRALMACYGIPNSMLNIKEYGGPKQTSNNRLDLILNKYKKRPIFTNNGESAEISLVPHFDHTMNSASIKQIEMRIGTNDGEVFDYNSYGPHKIFNITDTGSFLEITPVESNTTNAKTYCDVRFKYNGIDKTFTQLPLLDGGYFHLLIGNDNTSGSEEFQVRIQKQKYNKLIINTGSAHSQVIDWTKLYLGGQLDGGTGHTGSIEDIRLWINHITNSNLENHTLSVNAYNGRTPTSSFYDLAAHYKFDELSTYPTGSFTITSVHPNRLIESHSMGPLEMTLSGFTSSSLKGYTYESSYDVPSGGNTNFRSTKIRREEQIQFSRLSPDQRSTISEYDRQPIDSDRLDIAFSPQNVINEDIISHIGNTDLDNYIGNPSDIFKETYPELESFSKEYWKKYENKNDFNALFKLLTKYDFSIFSQIKQVLPHRANKVLGVLIEPNILERSRVRTAIAPQLFETEKISTSLATKVKDITGEANNDVSGLIEDGKTLFDLTSTDNNNVLSTLSATNNNINFIQSSESSLNAVAHFDVMLNNITGNVRDYCTNIIGFSGLNSVYSSTGVRHVSGSSINAGYGEGWVTVTTPNYKSSPTGSKNVNTPENVYWRKYNYIYSTEQSHSLGLYSSRYLVDSEVIETPKSMHQGSLRNRYEGCTLSGQINVDSSVLPDNSPVIEVYNVNPNELKYTGDINSSGSLSVE